jgi:opacity protein-like surface antigen
VLYRFPVDSDDVSPFALGGLNIARVKVEGEGVGPGGSGSRTDTDLGLNLGGGVTFLTGQVRPSVGLGASRLTGAPW